MLNRFLLLIVITLTSYFVSSSEPTVITMGYKTTQKLPYINRSPDNGGLYYELYSEAAKRIDAKLKIVRMPKARILAGIEEGSIDFYPAFSFTKERAKFGFWLNYGVKGRDLIMTRDDFPDINSHKDLNGLVYLVALGNTNYFENVDFSGVKFLETAELDLERAVKLILSNRADFYVYEEDALKYYIKSSKIKGIKLHRGFEIRSYWYYAGFSRNSPLYKGYLNPNFDELKEEGPENFRHELAEGSVLYRFREALMDMSREGYTSKLYKKYLE